MTSSHGGSAEQQPIRITDDMLAAEPVHDTRIDFEQGMSYAPRATLMVIVALGAVFAWQIDAGALASRETIIAAGALVRDRVLQGEWWRLFSATTLHGNAEHIISNAVSLYILGMACEHGYGTRAMMITYLVSGLTGSLLSIAMSPGPSVGASGAIFGLMGAVIVLFKRHHAELLVRDKRIGVVVAVWALFTIFTGLMNPMIDNAGHVGGLIGGMVTASLFRPRILERKVVRIVPERYRIR